MAKRRKGKELDPITLNVIRHRLWSVVDEMGTTIKRTAVSPIIWDANDFQTGILLGDGRIAQTGAYGASHSSCHYFIARAILERCSDNPGIFDGDHFMMNDPYMGGSPHPADVCIMAPVFSGKELLFWVCTSAHLLDIGASKTGSPREIYEEGLRLSPVKLVERGTVRKDVFDMFINFTRFEATALDLHAMMAANNVARERLQNLCERFGPETVRDASEMLIEFSEKKIREKLRRLPDGVFRHTDYLDHDGFDNLLFKVVLTMTKKGDSLTFDYTGSSPQARGIINTCIGGAMGAVFGLLGNLIAYDAPYNHGLFNAVNVILPPGTIVNAECPAAASGGSTSANWTMRTCAETCLLKLMSCSEEFRDDLMACWMGSTAPFGLGGVNQYGDQFFYPVMDHLAGGCGARSFRDGVGTAGTPSSTMTIPNVETHEEFAPFLMLFRREGCDTGGAGKYRGGLSIEEALLIRGGEKLYCQTKCNGVIVPNSTGLFGGSPGCVSIYFNYKNSNVPAFLKAGKIPTKAEEIQGEKEQIPTKITGYQLKSGDCVYYWNQGGGGYGDPLERDPKLVEQDVRNGYVSREQAETTYGVAFEQNSAIVDEEATRQLREQMKKGRLFSASSASLR